MSTNPLRKAIIRAIRIRRNGEWAVDAILRDPDVQAYLLTDADRAVLDAAEAETEAEEHAQEWPGDRLHRILQVRRARAAAVRARREAQ